MQWVETDDLGVSKRQVAAVSKNALPNGILPHAKGSSQQPPTGPQQPQGSMEQQQGSLQQPQGNMHQPQGVPQAPQGGLQQHEGGVHGAEGSGDIRAEGRSEHQLSAEQANPSGRSEQLVKQQVLDADQVFSPTWIGPKQGSCVERCDTTLFVVTSEVSQADRSLCVWPIDETPSNTLGTIEEPNVAKRDCGYKLQASKQALSERYRTALV